VRLTRPGLGRAVRAGLPQAVQPLAPVASRAVAKYDEQVARALAGAHNTARVAHGTPDYVRVGAGLGSAFVWALLDLADAIRSHGQAEQASQELARRPARPPSDSPF
jgi:hypothetical protein